MQKKPIYRTLQLTAVFLAIATASPILLGQLEAFKAAENKPTFQKANDPINYGTATVSYSAAISRAAPAVVSIHSTKVNKASKEFNALQQDPVFRHFFGDLSKQMPKEMQSGLGSGVIVAKEGYILTNNHVVNEATSINVKLTDGRSATAKVVGTDPDTDLAILKIDLKDLPVIAMGNSEALKVGDIVFAIGNPFGVGQTVTHGIISATQRNDLGISTFENFIQTDAAINPGNSGGALIDVNGNLIGINNAIYSRTGGFQGIGFAIPVSLAQEVMGELINQGHVIRGWLGISVSKLSDELRKSLKYPKGDGAVVAGIVRGGPAHVSGLRPGDIIISLDNKPVKTANEVLSMTAKLKPETAYPIAIVRNGETLDFRIVVGKRPVSRAAESATKAPEPAE
jgi:Do/DeqQ family serine protease